MEIKSKESYLNVDFFEDLTGTIAAGEEKPPEGIGKRIERLRTERGVSLEELSGLTGFDVKRLSNIEQGTLKPQLGTIIKLSKALDGAFGRLVSGVGGDNLYTITRKADRKPVSRSTSRKDGKRLYSYKSLASDVKGRHMESLMVELEAVEGGESSVHEGEEFIYVTRGTVLLTLGEETFELEPGDSVYYLSTTPHLLTAKDGKAMILAVLYGG
jgi:quercetin dioxygenase-like cupin family protein